MPRATVRLTGSPNKKVAMRDDIRKLEHVLTAIVAELPGDVANAPVSSPHISAFARIIVARSTPEKQARVIRLNCSGSAGHVGEVTQKMSSNVASEDIKRSVATFPIAAASLFVSGGGGKILGCIGRRSGNAHAPQEPDANARAKDAPAPGVDKGYRTTIAATDMTYQCDSLDRVLIQSRVSKVFVLLSRVLSL